MFNSKEKIQKTSQIAMLVAITVILGYVSGFLRIGNITKISVSFIPVYIASIFIGPVAGGVVGAVADFISYIVNPTGAYLWQLTVIEFVYGILFGIVFSRRKTQTFNYINLNIRIFIFSLIQFIINIILKTLVLMHAGFMPQELALAMSMRMPGVFVVVVLNFMVINLLESTIPLIGKTLRK